MRRDLKLALYVVCLYICFVSWGYLQEKITSTTYISFKDSTVHYRWKYPLVLNTLMALGAYMIADLAEFIRAPKPLTPTPFTAYLKPAFTCAIASPIGYAALDYINFPLMILAKSSKPVPVMLIGVLFYGVRYTWYKYLSVLLICGGIVLFTAFKSKSETISRTTLDELLGIFLVSVNLFLDGYTSNQQDFLFATYDTPAITLMKNVNLLQTVYLLLILIAGFLLWEDKSELVGAYELIAHSVDIRTDIALFCACASVGQLFIFGLMKDFGALTWITVSITRKLFTVMFSVFAFKHQVLFVQWVGVASVFAGMAVEVAMNYAKKKAAVKKDDDEPSQPAEESDDKKANKATKGGGHKKNKAE